MHDAKTLAAERVDALFVDIRDRRFLKWLFSEEPTIVFHYRDGSPHHSIDLDVQDEIKAAWASIIAAALVPLCEGLAEAERERDRLVLSTGEHITRRSELLARALAAEAKLSALQEEVGRLTRERDEARAALEPFAAIAEDVAKNHPGWNTDGFHLTSPGWPYVIKLGPFRRARSALARTAGGKDAS